jgi:hypothetical protein
MIDIAGLNRSALDTTRTTVAGIEPGQWTASTPNEAWNVRALHTTLAWALTPAVLALAVVVTVATVASRHPADWHNHNAPSPASR